MSLPRLDFTRTSEYPSFFYVRGSQKLEQDGNEQKRFPDGKQILSTRALQQHKNKTPQTFGVKTRTVFEDTAKIGKSKKIKTPNKKITAGLPFQN